MSKPPKNAARPFRTELARRFVREAREQSVAPDRIIDALVDALTLCERELIESEWHCHIYVTFITNECYQRKKIDALADVFDCDGGA